MLSFKNKIYATLFISFILLLSSILLAYKNIQASSKTLKHVSQDHSKLNYNAYRLNYIVKNEQSELLHTFVMQKEDSKERTKQTFYDIQSSLNILNEFLKEHPNVSVNFSKKLKTIEEDITQFKEIRTLLSESFISKDSKKTLELFKELKSLTETFNKETQLLVKYANSEVHNHIESLTQSRASELLLLSFLIGTLLIGFSGYKFNQLNNRLHSQLLRAKSAEDNLQEIQNDLENQISKTTKELHEKIYTNTLSALPNRNRLLEDIPHSKFAYIAILNIDKFQSFNDVYGEEIGNVALKMSADFIKKELDNSMFLYHIGGDEFVIASQENNSLTEETFIVTIENILRNFRRECFSYENKSFQFIMSAGVSFGTKQKMLAHADMALKDAKKRNIQLSIFNDDNELEKSHQNSIECRNKLLYALDNDDVISYFQPISPIQDTNKKVKYESLVRLRDREGKIISPLNFLNVAKANRIYYKITRTVINNTLANIEKHQIPCSLNLSLTDVENEKTMRYFYDVLDTFEYTELLTVELLETEDFSNYQLVYDFCVKVRSYGVKVALDDFGSGYSNFSHILRLPVDYIKIDSSLISNIDRDVSSQIMVETIVELAHKLNVLTIAEFVSSEKILAVVKDLGVDYAQGFYIGKPLAIDEHISS